MTEQLSFEVDNDIKLKSKVSLDETTEEISKAFDYEFTGEVSETIPFPQLPPPPHMESG